MLQISNRTPFTVDLSILRDEEGIDTGVAVIKSTFTIAPDIIVSKSQMPVIKNDEYRGKPGHSSLKYASEITLPKPATDIVMIGNAYAQNRKKLHVSLKVGDYSKTVAVFGDRYWKRTLGFHFITDPKPFTKIPLIYEKSFGGVDVHGSDKNKIECEPRNPVGCGFKIRKGRKRAAGLKLPNIEDPDHLVRSIKHRPMPAGFGYIAPAWEPRKSFTGTFDEKWEKYRAPYLPEDFDSRFLNCAHPDLITDGYLQGGEEVFIENATWGKIIKFNLPKMEFKAVFNIDGRKIIHQPALDTLILEPDDNRFSMIWRASERCDKKVLKVQRVDIHCIESNINLEVR